VSRRLPTSPLAVTFFLLFVVATLSPILATPASAFGERVYDSNTVLSGTNYLNVYSGQSVAQSFLASASYRLLSLTLRLRNSGDTSDAVNITIRTNSANEPSVTVLAASQFVIGNNGLGNVAVPLSTPPRLAEGVRYWIVATSASSLLNTYEWHHSGSDTYANGQALTNLGGGWGNPLTPTDMYFITTGREAPANLTATLRAPSPKANPGDDVTFRLFLNNTGDSAAITAWLNDTRLPGFTYQGDTAASAGSTTPWPSFTFPSVENGPRSFDLTARVDLGTEPGTILTKALTLAYTNESGVVKTASPAQTSLVIGTQGKQLYLNPKAVGAAQSLDAARPTGGSEAQFNETLKRDDSTHDFDLDPVLARPFRAMTAITTLFLDSKTHDARNLRLNLTLTDWNGVTFVPVAYVEQLVTTNAFVDYQPFVFPLSPFDHTFPSGGRLRLTIRNLGPSQMDAVLAMNSTFAASFVDLDTATYVRIDRIDMRDGTGSTTTWSPKSTLVVEANISDPFGSTEIAGARIDLTSPSGAVVVNYTAMALLATDSATPSAWKLFRFTLAPPLSEGTYRATVTAEESNGVLDIAEAAAVVRAPSFTIVKSATDSNVRSGDLFTYDLWFNNTGSGPAGRVWLNDTLPGELDFLSSSDPGAMTGNYNWTWMSLGIGNYRLSINVQVRPALPPIPYVRNYAFLNYTDEKGFSWPTKVAFADVALSGPVISLSKTSAKTVIHSNETIVYTVTMQNTGDVAQTLWVNDTLPAGLTYVSDTATEELNGTVQVFGNMLFVRLENMPGPRIWSFSVTAVAAPNLARGAHLMNVVSLNYTNSNGFLLPPRIATRDVPVSAPEIVSAALEIVPNQATPADTITAIVTFSNTGSEAAQDAWVNLTLDQDLLYLNATFAPDSASGNEVRFRFANVPIATTTIFLNASVNSTVLDHDFMAIGGTVTYTDAYRNVLPPVSIASDKVEASVPQIRLTITPDVATVEAGAPVFFNIFLVNAGSGVAGDVLLSLPLPASFSYADDTADVDPAVVGTTYEWRWSNVAPGARSFSLKLQAKPTVLDRTRTNLTFHVDYTDVNGNFRIGETAFAEANFVTSEVNMVLTPPVQESRVGQTITLSMEIQNIGASSAHNVWLTYRDEPHLEIVTWGSSSALPVRTGTGLNWSFTDMQPDQRLDLTLVLRIRDGTPAGLSLFVPFEANYTNSADIIIGHRAVNAEVRVLADITPLIWIGVAGSGLAVLTFIAIVRRTQIEEVFLVYRDGVLLYHLSRSLSQDKDEDVLSGMLTAVTEFVRDAFVYGEHRELHQLDFGDYRIMIERGQNLYLAVVYSGKAASSIRKRVRSVMNHIETAYGSVLDKWDGDMEKVVGARDLIREYLLKNNGRSRLWLPGLP